MKKNKTTAKHFEIFKVECQKWIEIFGIKSFEILYDHSDYLKNNKASTTSHSVNRWATLRLNITWDEYWELTDDNVKRCAFHEVVELLLAPLINCAESRYVSENEIEEQSHVIIRTLENVLWEKE